MEDHFEYGPIDPRHHERVDGDHERGLHEPDAERVRPDCRATRRLILREHL